MSLHCSCLPAAGGRGVQHILGSTLAIRARPRISQVKQVKDCGCWWYRISLVERIKCTAPEVRCHLPGIDASLQYLRFKGRVRMQNVK
jgi:hypothetical protein